MRKYYDNALTLMSNDPTDYAGAFALLSKAVDAGDARALYAMATWYLHGTHVEKDIKKGTAMLKSAANANVADALFDLAVSYETGVGVVRSEKKAAQHYLRAAFAGDVSAFRSVGRCLYYGIGFVKDRVQATIWLEKARKLNQLDGVSA